MDITFIIAIAALAATTAQAVRAYAEKRHKVPPTLGYHFSDAGAEAMYFSEEEDTIVFPHYGSDEAAGFDIRSNETVTVDPGQFITVRTGLHFGIPVGYELQIRTRSGLAAKYGIHVLNSPGTIDSDYTGELKVILRNSGATRRVINLGERIAQAVFAKVASRPETKQHASKDTLKKTERGESGLGSTGVK